MDASDWDRRYAAADLVWSAGPNQFVAAETAELRPGRALDLACGEGRNALWLASRGWRVDAVDFSPVALDTGREVERSTGDPSAAPVDWQCGDALTHPLGEGYDLVLLAYLHLPEGERRTVLRRAFAALAEGGTFLLVAHDATNLDEGTGGPQDPAVLASAEEVLSDLDGLRFEVRQADRVARLVGPADDHRGEAARTAWDCLVRLERTG